MAKRKGFATWRVWALVAVISLGTLAVVARLVQLQIIDHSEYADQARLMHENQVTLSDRRGAILDRNGHPLAASADSFAVYVENRSWKDPAKAAEAAREIVAICGGDWEEMVATVQGTDIFEVPVAEGLNFGKAEMVKNLSLHGVRLVRTSQRVYPEGSLASQLLGIVGRDNIGLTGLEADLNPVLAGLQGSYVYERDGLGNPLAIGDQSSVPAQPGQNVVLTIDRYIQRLAERELDKAVKEHGATGGTIIVVQPETGEILAMANRPAANLNDPDLSSDSALSLLRNRAITDSYEPGSTFKLITMAGALDSGLVSPGTWWEDIGVFYVDGWAIRNWDLSANGSQTVTQLLAKSLNTGAAWLSSLLGPELFYDYVHRFGFGAPTGIDLSGEVEGQVRTPSNDPSGWRPVDMATNSFGQGISATPLQVAMAVAAIGNGGLAMKPQIIREIGGPAGTVIEPEPGQQAITPESARTLLEMMGVVVDGIPNHLLDLEGYSAGGKTGTANIADGNGSYKDGAYISSFAGVAPLEDPQLAVLVKIDEPKDVPWGTVVAAPAFGNIVEDALAYLKVPPHTEAMVSAQQ